MSVEPAPIDELPPLEIMRVIHSVCDEFEAALKTGGDVSLEPYCERVETTWRKALIKQLAYVALDHMHRLGIGDPYVKLFASNTSLREDLEHLFPTAAGELTVAQYGPHDGNTSGLVVRCPHCHNTIELVVDASLIDIDCRNCGGSFSLVNDTEHTRDAETLAEIAHFQLIERLGMGGFGTVWKARDTILDRTVALKLPRGGRLDEVSTEKFMREARAAAQLSHPNIVSTHEVGRHTDTLYIVSDYIRGVSLAEMITDHRLSIRESVTIASKIADALDYAHRAGVVHRDLKPSNILVDGHGEPHLMDFGLAKRKEWEITITADGDILGTPAYMSPEQARGEAARVDGRSDIYSLGVVLFQLITGELPFRGSTRMLLQKVISDDPPGPRTLDSRVSKDLDTICLKCLEKDPVRRYATAGDLGADLRNFMGGRPIAARRIGAAGKMLKWARRNRAIAFLLSATMITLVAATAISSYFAWRAAQNAAEKTDTLYDSTMQEMRLTRAARQQGYGEKIHQLIDRARQLNSARFDKDEIRRELVLSMGDFLAYSPRPLRPFEADVVGFQMTNDRQNLVVGLSKGQILWCDAKGEGRSQLARLPSLSALGLSKDDDVLFAADRSGNIRTWHRFKGKWSNDHAFQTGEQPRLIAFSPNGEMVAATTDESLEVWDVSAQKMLHTFPIEAGRTLHNLAFDFSLARIFAGYTITETDEVGWAAWELAGDPRPRDVHMPSLGQTYGDGLKAAPSGDRMAIGFDEALLVYDLASLQATRLSGFDSTKALAFSPTNLYLAALNIRGSINVWNPATNRHLATLELQSLKMGRNRLAFSRDGTRLIASQANAIQIWDLDNANEMTTLLGHQGGIPCATFHPGGRILATGGKDGLMRFWSPADGKLLESINVGDAIQTLSFSPDGRLLAVGCMGKPSAPHLRIIDTQTKKVVFESAPAMGEVYSLSWAAAADGWMLSGCGRHGIAIWKMPKGSPVRLEPIFERRLDYCLAIVFNPQADLLVWVQNERKLKAWDILADREVPLHASDLQQGWHGLAFLPDGQSIAYISSTGVAEVWNLREDRRVASMGDPGTFRAPHIALSANGEWIAALTQPDSVSVWHRPTGVRAFSLRPESSTVWALAWDPSNENLAVGQSDGGLEVWHLPAIQKKLADAGLK
jgi:WD40 repeat protein/tRNA A-37 threonylcarbamoyl transferase component Bud32